MAKKTGIALLISVGSDADTEETEQCTPDNVNVASPWSSPPGIRAEDEAPKTDAGASSAAGTERQASGCKKQAWTKEEDDALQALVAKHGPTSWSEIAKSLPGRIGKQCRERWHNHLSPEVKKEGFTDEEDRKILEAVAEHGTKWSLIVKLIPGRTDNAIKNRWNSAQRKLQRQQRRGTAPAENADLDLATLGPQELARHLLATGLDPRMPRPAPPRSEVPRAKRKLAITDKPAGKTASTPACASPSDPPGKLQRLLTGGGLDLLCRLAPALGEDAGMSSPRTRAAASPRALRAAMSLGGFCCLSDRPASGSSENSGS